MKKGEIYYSTAFDGVLIIPLEYTLGYNTKCRIKYLFRNYKDTIDIITINSLLYTNARLTSPLIKILYDLS